MCLLPVLNELGDSTEYLLLSCLPGDGVGSFLEPHHSLLAGAKRLVDRGHGVRRDTEGRVLSGLDQESGRRDSGQGPAHLKEQIVKFGDGARRIGRVGEACLLGARLAGITTGLRDLPPNKTELPGEWKPRILGQSVRGGQGYDPINRGSGRQDEGQRSTHGKADRVQSIYVPPEEVVAIFHGGNPIPSTGSLEVLELGRMPEQAGAEDGVAAAG